MYVHCYEVESPAQKMHAPGVTVVEVPLLPEYKLHAQGNETNSLEV